MKLPSIASVLRLVFASLMQAQDLKFDVVSIKPIPSDRSTDRFVFTRGRTLRSSATLSGLIAWAYQNQDFQSSGWIVYGAIWALIPSKHSVRSICEWPLADARGSVTEPRPSGSGCANTYDAVFSCGHHVGRLETR